MRLIFSFVAECDAHAGRLTEDGIRQADAAAAEGVLVLCRTDRAASSGSEDAGFLERLPDPELAFTSGRPAASETVHRICEKRGWNIDAIPHLAFSEYEEGDPGLPFFDFLAIHSRLLLAHGDAITAYHWLEAWPLTWLMRGRMLFAMHAMADAQAAIRPPDAVVHYLVGSHSPLMELAAPDTRNMRAGKPGKVLHYEWTADRHGETRLTGVYGSFLQED